MSTPTRPYAIPRVIPEPDDCTEADLLDICAATIGGSDDLAGAPFAYLVMICTLVQNLDIERTAQAARIAELTEAVKAAASHTEIAQGTASAFRRELTASREAHAAATAALVEERTKVANLSSMLAHETAYSITIQMQHAALTEQLAAANRPAVIELVERSAAQCRADAAALDRTEFDTLERAQRRRERPATIRQCMPRFDTSDATTSDAPKIVVDQDYLDGPACDRTPTPRERTLPMGVENGWST